MAVPHSAPNHTRPPPPLPSRALPSLTASNDIHLPYNYPPLTTFNDARRSQQRHTNLGNRHLLGSLRAMRCLGSQRKRCRHLGMRSSSWVLTGHRSPLRPSHSLSPLQCRSIRRCQSATKQLILEIRRPTIELPFRARSRGATRRTLHSKSRARCSSLEIREIPLPPSLIFLVPCTSSLRGL